MDMHTERRSEVYFSSGDSNMEDKPYSGWPHTAVMPGNEKHLNQLTCADWWIMTRELCTELHICFSALEMIVATLEYHKVCARWVSQILAWEQKENSVYKFVMTC